MNIATTPDATVRRRRSHIGFLADSIRRSPLTAFFVLAYAISWSTSAAYLITGSGPVILNCGPALAAIAVLAITGGRPGLRSLFRRMTSWRVGTRWWAVAVLGPVALTALATALNIALGAPVPSDDDLARWTNVLPTAALILLVPVIGGAWEEPGWRGFALPRLLLTKRSPLAASLVLGSFWAGWHLPVLLAGEQHWSDLALIVMATVVITWVFQNTLGSLLIAMVLHAMNNAVSGEYVSQMFDGADSARQSWLLLIVWSAAALLVVAHWRRGAATAIAVPPVNECAG